MLDAADEAGQPTLGRRLAALCAEEANRPLLMSRVDAAVNLELALIAGVPIDAWTPPPGVPSGRELIGEIEEHLRALLRDVVCGYLKPELASMADEILLRSGSMQVQARDVPEHAHLEPHPLDPPTVFGAPALAPPEAEPRVTRLVDVINQAEPEPEPERQWEREREPGPEPEPEPAPEPAEPMLGGEHQSPRDEPATPHRERHQASIHELRPLHEQPALVVDDFAWDLDDGEPGDYSAPV
jgi:hypothetical protein